EELKAEQYKGIKRALKRKAEGTGSYGRPRAKLPADFEKQLKERIRKQEDLSSYCKELEMKKSTFYKWVKIYRSAWDSEKINSN
ncbi:ribose ABC transporter substrate-binding protein, partial [[Clostridium] innocuum]|nr:ribose ABC transporter substrate-binding protein [[Clostridium] innocuum]